MANVTTNIDKLVVPIGSDIVTANLVDTVSGYTKNTGTVTSVSISGTSPISASGTVTSTGTLSVSHATSGVTAQSTQALYPFKVNSTGHITSVGSAVSVPTKTSDLTNDSGFITSSGAPVQSVNSETGDVVLSVANGTTGISIADHATTSIYGVKENTTTASKVTVSGGNGSAPTLGTAFTVPNVTVAGSGSYTQGAFTGGSFSATVTNHEMSFSFTPATHGTDSHTHVAPTLGTAFTIPNVTSAGSASTWSISASDVTVPIKDTTATTVVTGKTHSITDNGHVHSITAS